MKTKFIKRVMAVTMTAIMTLGLVAMRLPSGIMKVYGANEIAINETNFDARICTYLSEKYDSDSDGYIDDVNLVTGITISDSENPVASLEGLEKLTNLQSLDISHGTFTSADLSGCTKLKTIELYMCYDIVSLNVTGLAAVGRLDLKYCSELNTITGIEDLADLSTLIIQYTKMESLDLRNNSYLTYIDVSSNELHTLKVSGLSSVYTLRCPRNAITELDLTGCTAINQLWCSNNSWSSPEPLDLTKIPNVTDLDIGGPYYDYEGSTEKQIERITFPVGCKLEDLDVSGNALTSLDVTNCTELTGLSCGENPLASLTLDNPKLTNINMWVVYTDSETSYALDTSKCPALEDLDLMGNYMINAVDLKYNTALESLELDGTAITELDLTYNTELWSLTVDSRAITSLDLSHNTKISYLDLNYAGLTSLDVSMLTKLKTLNIGSVPITSLDLSGLSSLEKLYANYSYGGDQYDVLESIDFTGCTGLKYVELENIENLHSVDLSDSTLLEELEIDLAKVLVCKLPASNTTVVIDERQSTVYIKDVEETFDLKTIVPDIDASKIKGVQGSKDGSTVSINGTVLSGYQLYEYITYQYDCGNGMVINPELYVKSFVKSQNSWTTPLTMEGWTYSADNSTAKNPNAVAKYGTVKYTYSTSENGTYTSTKPSTAGTYWVKATVAETSTYYGLEAKTSFTISKATPSYTTPTSLKALAGQTLLNVTLPTAANGTFEWLDGSLSVGNVGKNTFEVIFTPNDTDNYNTLTGIEVEVEVSLNENSWTTPLSMDGWTYSADNSTAKNPNAVSKYGTPVYTYSTSKNGTYTATKPSTAGTYWVKAMVAETNIYEGLESDAVMFVIAQATPQYEVPTDLEALALQSLSDVELPEGFAWENPNVVFDKSGIKTFEATFTPADTANYKIVENIEIDVYVDKNPNGWIEYPSIASWTYGEAASEPDMGQAKYGVAKIMYGPNTQGPWSEEVPIEAGSYCAKFYVESDGATYYGVGNHLCTFRINPATPSYEVPTGLSAYVGQTLADIALPTGFSWENAATELDTAGTFAYEATFTPADTTNYKTVENISINVTVNKYANAWTSELTMEGWTYGEAAKAPSAAAKYGTVVYAYSTSANGTFASTVPSNAGTYYVKATVAESGSYTGLESEAVRFVIKKANPTYTVPASLRAMAGQTLADVVLTGGFAWEDDTLSVGLKGINTFMATFTPEDLVNYNILGDIEIKVEVSLNANAWTSELTMEGWTYGEAAKAPNAVAKYGTPVYTYSNAADGTFTGTVPVEAGTWYVKAAVAESDIYEGLASDAVSFVIERATPSYTIPADLNAYVGQKLSDVTLPAGFVWMDETLSVGAMGTKVFKVKYTPADTANYVSVENIDVNVVVSLNENAWTSELTIEDWTYGDEAEAPSAVAKYGTVMFAYSDAENGTYVDEMPENAGTWYVKAIVVGNEEYTGLESAAVAFEIQKATPEYTAPTDLKAEVGQTLADVKLPSGFAWADEKTSVGKAGNNKFKAVYTPANAANYESVEVELTVNVKAEEVNQEAIYTGDISAVELWFVVMIVSMITFMLVSKKKKCVNQ